MKREINIKKTLLFSACGWGTPRFRAYRQCAVIAFLDFAYPSASATSLAQNSTSPFSSRVLTSPKSGLLKI